MKKHLVYLTCCLGALFMASCTDDLNTTSTDETVQTGDAFWSQPSAYKQALAGVYGNLSLTGTGDSGSSFLQGVDAGTSQYGRCLYYLEDFTTDEAIWSYENDPGARELNRNIWTASNPIILGMYSRIMVGVSIANDYLKQTTSEKVSGYGITDEAVLANIPTYRAEARVIRALDYYYMIDLFGKAPFVDENSPEGVAPPEYSRQQLYDYVIAELNDAMADLKPARSNEYGRVDQGVAHMILAKLYLNAEVYTGTAQWDNCVSECNAVMAGGYTLNSNYLNNFTADNNLSPELIFALESDGVKTQNYGPTTVLVNGEVGSIEQNGVSVGVSAGAWGGAIRLRKQFAQKFDGSAFSSDARNTIISGTRPIDITNISDRNQGYILQKYSNLTSTGVPGINTTFVDTDFPLFRLADVYLMYAECALRGASGASASQALSYVNMLRERAHGGGTSGNIAQGDLTLDFILDERARELHWEAHRRQDLIRFGKYTSGTYNWAWKGNGQNGIALQSFMKLFPIPANALASNANLTQNPGY